MRRLRGYKSKTRVMIPKQAIFGGTDSQVVQGDDDGRVHIFDLVSGRKLQSLSHAYGMLTVPAPNGHNVKVNSTLQGKRSIQTVTVCKTLSLWAIALKLYRVILATNHIGLLVHRPRRRNALSNCGWNLQRYEFPKSSQDT